MRTDDPGPGGSALSDELGPAPKRGFIERTNADYSAWCRTHYAAHALDARGMASLHGLWAWQEQEKRIAAAVAAERERCARVADEHSKRTFPWGSENAEIYHAQADWAAAIAKSIRQLKA